MVSAAEHADGGDSQRHSANQLFFYVGLAEEFERTGVKPFYKSFPIPGRLFESKLTRTYFIFIFFISSVKQRACATCYVFVDGGRVELGRVLINGHVTPLRIK